MSHGFWAIAEIERNPRTAAFAEWLLAELPTRGPGDEVTVWLAAGCIERVLRGREEIAKRGLAAPNGMRRDLGTAERTISRLLNDLGLTPTARAKLGLDRVRGAALIEHIERNYGRGKR
jgi:hypothetical protein